MLVWTAAIAWAAMFAVAAPAFAQGLGGTINGGLGFGTIVGWGTQDLRVTIMRVIQILFGFLGVVAIAVILYAGWLWMTSGGDPQKIDRAKRILVEAVIGLLVIFSAFAIVSFVVRSLTGATGPQGGGPGSCAAGQYWCPATSSCVNLGDPCGFGGAGGQCLVVVSSPHSPPKVPMNAKAWADFTLNPDAPAQNPANFAVACVAGTCTNPVDGGITLDGRRATFTPAAPCPGFPGENCFAKDSSFQVTLKAGDLKCGGKDLQCGATDCQWQFETNDRVDITPPTVSVGAVNICQAVNSTIAYGFSDDFGVSTIDFSHRPAGGAFQFLQTVGVNSPGGSGTLTLDTSAWALGVHTIQAVAYDFTGRTATAQVDIAVWPGHCCDAFINNGETGLNCGGPECGACSGANCDIDKNDVDAAGKPICQPNPAACAFACSSTSCLCVEPPFIDYVSPANDVKNDNDGDPADADGDQFNDDVPFGAVGNLATIIGRNFGPLGPGSKVEFTCAGGGCWVEAKLADDPVDGNPLCSGVWRDGQIIVIVPVGAVPGPIRVTTADGLEDTTDMPLSPRSSERAIPNFSVTGPPLPGICGLEPDRGEFRTAVKIHGLRLDRNDGNPNNDFVKFGGHIAALAPSTVWDATTNLLIDSVVVPSIVPGPVQVWAEIDGGARSNTVGFTVTPGVDHPVILDFNPKSGAEQDYVTILGANFGSRQGRGTVKFCGDAGCSAAAQKDGNFIFPNQCGGNIWSNSRILVKVPAGTQDGKLEVITDANLRDSTTDTNGPNLGNLTVGGTAGPGICKIEPDNGPAGEARVRFFGERMGATSEAWFTGVTAAAPKVGFMDGLALDEADVLTVTVPGGAQSGDAFVRNPGTPDQDSNTLWFTVNDCRSALACTGSQECCAVGPHAGSCAPPGTCGGVTLASSYRWYFLTGKAGPRVVEACTRSNDCSAGGYSSPTPPRGSTVPINAAISALIDRPLDPGTVTKDNVLVQPCADPAKVATCDPSITTKATARNWVLGNDLIKVEVVDGDLGRPGIQLKQNQGYRVTLTKDIRAPSGEQLVGNDTNSGNYVWTFKTRNDPALGQIGCLACSPRTWELYVLGGPPVPLTGDAYDDVQACVALDTSAYSWVWKSADPSKVSVNTTLTGPANTATAQAETPGTNVEARIPVEAPGKVGICRVSVNLQTPVVTEHWPSCNSACVNAELGAAFSLPMNDDTVADPGFGRSVTNPANVKLYVCGLDYACTLASSLEVPLLGNPTYAAISRPEVTFQPAASHNGGLLIAGVYYRAVISGNVQSFAGKGLGALNYDTDGNGSADSYSWVFKVRENFSVCQVGRVDVQPGSVTTYPPSLVNYQAVPRSTADECSSAGQRINPYRADWNWISTNLPVATLLTPLRDACGNGVIEPGEECDDGNITDGDGCSGHDLTGLVGGANGPCVEENDPQTGSTQAAPYFVCGNGILENNGLPWDGNDELCDDGNRASGDGCSSTCLPEGSRFGQSRCGDGIVGPGEGCETCGLAGSLRTIFSGSCPDSDLAFSRTAASSDGCSSVCTVEGFTGNSNPAVTVCGNAAVESGEECDTGIGGLGTLTDGCTDTCINTGSVYELADPPNVGPRQIAQAAGADGVSTIRATYANGVFGTGIFTVPSPAAGGTGPFQIISKQPSGDIPACLNELVVITFSTEPDVTTLDGNIVVTPGGGVPGARIQKLPGTNQVQIRPPGTPSRWQPETTYEIDLKTNATKIRDVGGRQLICDAAHVCTWTFTAGKTACRAVDLDVSPSFTVVKPNTDTNPPYLASLLGASRPAAVSGITALGGSSMPRLVNFLGCSADANVCVKTADGVSFTIGATSVAIAVACDPASLASPVSVPGLRSASQRGANSVVDLGCGVGFDFSGLAPAAGNWSLNLDPAYRAVLAPDISFKWNYTQLQNEPAVEDAGDNQAYPTCVLRVATAVPECKNATAAARDAQYLVHGVIPWTPFVGAREADIRAAYDPDGLSGTARFVVGNLCQLPYRAATRYSIYPLQADANTLAIGHFDGTARLLLGNGTPLEPQQQSGLTYGNGLTDGGGRVLGQSVVVDEAGGTEDQLIYPAQNLISPTDGTISLWYQMPANPGLTAALHNLMVVRKPGAGQPNLHLFLTPTVAGLGGNVAFRYVGSSASATAEETFTPSTEWAYGSWHFVVASWQASGGTVEVSLSIDGRPAKTDSDTTAPFALDASAEILLGQEVPSFNEAEGAFDELEFSSAVFSDEEIEARYEAVAARCISGAGAAGTPQVWRCTPTGDASGATCTDVTTPISCSSPLISVTFSQPMDRATLLAKDGSGEYANVLLCTDADYTAAGSTCTPANNVIEGLQYNPLVNQLQVERPAGLAVNTKYHVVLKTGPDKILGESGLPLSSGAAGDFHWQFAIAAGAGRCQCNEVITSVAPPSPAQPRREDAFSCAGSNCLGDQDNTIVGNQHVYAARCFDRAANQPTASVNYLWRKDFDVAGILKLTCPSCVPAGSLNDDAVIASNTLVDGAARLSVIATGISPTIGTAQGFLDVSNFVCSNPWPDPWKFPWQDTAAGFPLGAGPQENKSPVTNFELFYCRDFNDTEDANDDLPPLETRPTVRASSLPKQFLFPLNYFQGSDAIQIVAGATSVNVSAPRGPLSGNPEFGAAYQECQTYPAENAGATGGIYKLSVLKAGHYQVAFEVVHYDTDFEPPSQVSIAIDRNRNGSFDATEAPEQHQRLPSLKSRQVISFDLGQQAPGDVTVALRYEGDDATQNPQEEFAICRAAVAVANIKNDVIGVQVRANPFRLSPATWYRSGVCRGQTPSADPGDLKGLCFADADCPGIRCDFNVPNRRGAPASLAVDGYPAVRDGRTVYVGATNLTPLDNGAASRCSQTLGTACTVGAPLPAACTPAGGGQAGEACVSTALYANIYLVSYNEGAGEPTEQIFSALLADWKFNAGLVSLGACQQLRCSADGAICTDANTALKCSDGSAAACTTRGAVCGTGTCLPPTLGDACSGGAGTCGNIACSSDLDCPGKAQDSCLNPHDKIRRDAIRYGQLQDLQLSLRAASNRRGGTFPLWDAVRREFTGGTYVPGYTFSTWPSWGQTFGSQLGAGAPVDPINQFIGCPLPYHRETCWDEQGLRFGCPLQAYVYGYQVDGSRQGSGYTLSTRFEFPAADGGWRGNDLVGNACFNYLARGAGDRDGDGVMDVADNCQQKSNPYVCKNGPKLGEPCPDGPTGTECGAPNVCWQPDADDISGINLARKYGIIPDWFAIGGKWYTSPCQAGAEVRPEFTINGDRYNRNETYCTFLPSAAANNPFWLGELTTIFDYDTVDVYAFMFTGPIEICGTDDQNLDPANITCWPPVAFKLVNDSTNPLFDAAAPADAQSVRLKLPQRVRFRYLLINRTVDDEAGPTKDRIQEVEVYNNSGGDGFGDACDPCPHSTENDIDHDGVCENGLDNPQYGYWPDNCTNTYNPDQRNSDGIGGGDACDTTCTADLDRDGDCDARDNCPTVYNPLQDNVDGRESGGALGGARRFCTRQVDLGTAGVSIAKYPNEECTTLGTCKDTNDNDVAQLCQTPDQLEGQRWPNGTEWGDACDLCSDVDHDGWGGGLPAESCRPDNCAVSQNPGQEDFDRDGQGYLCDECTDSDNDRLPDQLVGNSSFEDGLNGWQLFKQAGVDAHLRQATDYLRLQEYFPSLNHGRVYRGVHSAEILIQKMEPPLSGTNRYLALRTVANPSFLYTAPNYGVRYVMQALVKPSDPQMVGRLHFRPILGCTGYGDGRAAVNGLEYKATCGDKPDFDDEAKPPNPVLDNNQGFRLPLLQPVQVKNLGNGWYQLRAEFAFADAFRNDPIAFELALELEDQTGATDPVSFGNNASLQIDDFQVSFLQANAEESCKRVGRPPLGFDPGEELVRPLDNCRTLNNPTRCVGGRYHGSICNTSLDCISPVRRNVKAVTVFEHSGAVKSYTFDAVSDAKLNDDIANEQALATAATPGVGCDIWTTQGECFDLFWSDALGSQNAAGTYLTVQAWREPGAADMGHNLDAVRLELVSGAAAWVTASSNLLANNVLGPTNGQYTALGNGNTSLTLDFGLQRATPTFASCKEILEAGAATRVARGAVFTFSHEYGVDLDRDGTDEETVFCDMETDGGGWTLVARMQDDDDGDGTDEASEKHWVAQYNHDADVAPPDNGMDGTLWFRSVILDDRLGDDDFKARAFNTIPLSDLMVTIHPDTYNFDDTYTPGQLPKCGDPGVVPPCDPTQEEIYAVWRNGIGDGTNTFARQPVWKAGYCPAYDPEAAGLKSGSRGTMPAPQTQARQCSSRPTLVATDDSSANGDLVVVVERFSEEVNLAGLKLYTNTKTGVGDDTRVNVQNVHSLYLRNWHRISGTDPAMVKAKLTFNNSNVTILGWAIDEDVSGTVQNGLNSTFSVTGGSMWPGGVTASDNGKFERTDVACQPGTPPGNCGLWNDSDSAAVSGATTATFNSIVVGDEADDARLLFTYNPATASPVVATIELEVSPQPAVHDYLQDLVVCDEDVSPTGVAQFSVVISEPVDPVHGIVLGPRDSDGPAANTCVKNGEIFGIGNQLDAWVEGDAPEISVIGFASGNDPANSGPQGLGNWTDGGAGGGKAGQFNDFKSIANFGGLFPPGNYGQLWFRERPVFTGVPGTAGSTGVSTLGVCLQPDYDEDNVGDACDRCTDRDFDRFGDAGFTVNGCAGSFFKRDNCPATYNPDQGDSDQDAVSCRYDLLQPYITAGSPLACNDALGFPLGGSCQFCGGDACDLDADGDVCYNWDRLKRQAGHGDNQRLPTGEIVAGLSVPNYRLYREEGYVKTLTHDEVTWRSASRDADVDGIADDCDAQACGNGEVENVRRAAPLRTLPGLEKIVVYEVSDCTKVPQPFVFPIGSDKLLRDINQDDALFSRNGLTTADCDIWIPGQSKCYDVFFSHRDGQANIDGGYLTVQSVRPPIKACLMIGDPDYLGRKAVNLNIDAVKLDFGGARDPLYVTEVPLVTPGVAYNEPRDGPTSSECNGGAEFQLTKAQTDWQNALGPEKLATCSDLTMQYTAGGEGPNTGFTFGFNTESVVNQCFNPVSGVQTCEQCDLNNFTVGSSCDKPFAVGSSATYRQIYPLQLNSNTLFLAHYDGKLDAKRGDGSTVDIQPPTDPAAFGYTEGLSDGSLNSAGNPIALGNSVEFKLGGKLVYQDGAGGNSLFAGGSNSRSLSVWVNVRNRVDRLTLFDFSAATIQGLAWQAGTWHHIAMTWTATDIGGGKFRFDNIRLYLDGLLHDLSFLAAEKEPPPNLDVGWWMWVVGLGRTTVWIDELEFLDDVLTADVIGARVSAIRQHCLAQASRDISRYMVENFCASCNNLRCQINNLRTCLPLDEFSFSSGSAGASSELAKPENRADTLWSLYYSDTSAVRSANGLEIHGIVATEGVAGKAIGTSLGMVDDAWGWAASKGNEADLSVFIDSPNDGHPPAAGSGLGLGVWGVVEDESASGGADEGVIVEVKLDAGGNATKERRCPAGRSDSGVSRTAADLYGNNWSLMDNGSWILMHYVRVNDPSPGVGTGRGSPKVLAGCDDKDGHVYGLNVNGARKMGIDDKNNLWVLVNNGVLRLELDWVYSKVPRVEGTRQDITVTHNLAALTCQMKFGAETKDCQVFNTPAAGEFAFDKDNNLWIAKWWAGPGSSKSDNSQVIYKIASGAPSNQVTTYTFPQVREPMYLTVDAENSLWVVNNEYVPGSAHKTCSGVIDKIGSLKKSLVKIPLDTLQPALTVCLPGTTNYGIAADSAGYLWAKNTPRDVQRYDVLDGDSVGLHTLPSGGVYSEPGVRPEIRTGLSPRIIQVIQEERFVDVPVDFSAVASAAEQWQNRWGKILYRVDPAESADRVVALVSLADDAARLGERWITVEEFNDHIGSAPLIGFDDYVNRPTDGEITGRYMRLRFRFPVTMRGTVTVRGLRITCRDGDRQICGQR